MNYEQKTIILSFTDDNDEKQVLLNGIDGWYPKLKILIDEYLKTSTNERGKKYAKKVTILQEVKKILAVSKAA